MLDEEEKSHVSYLLEEVKVEKSESEIVEFQVSSQDQ